MRPLVALTLLAFSALASTARADGLPVGGPEIGPSGVEIPGTGARVVALAGSAGTSVARIRRSGGRVELWGWLEGPLTIPAVAIDGSPGGLSHDGSKLVLIRPRPGFPQREVRLAVLSTRTLRVVKRIRLRGDFSYDALSPDAQTMYLIQYTSRRDPTRYLVRALDLRTGRLLADPIVDPSESPEEMRGFALTRAASPDGRWAYTLYDGGGEHPFVHALDTVEAAAVCIDLHALEGRGMDELMGLRLRVSGDGSRLEVTEAGTPRLRVDTATFRVATVAIGRRVATRVTDDGRATLAWPAAGLTAALLIGGGLMRLRLRGGGVRVEGIRTPPRQPSPHRRGGGDEDARA
jgi:hypothetical protein